MQKPPQLLPTKLEEAQAPGIRYRIDGELVPVLHTWLDGPAGPRERRFSAMRAFEAVTQHPRWR